QPAGTGQPDCRVAGGPAGRGLERHSRRYTRQDVREPEVGGEPDLESDPDLGGGSAAEAARMAEMRAVANFGDDPVESKLSFRPATLRSRKLRQTVATLRILLRTGCCNSQKAAGPRNNVWAEDQP